MTSLLLIVALVFGPPIGQKKREWKEAKILDVRYERKSEDMNADPRTGGMPTRTMIDTWTYIVNADGMRWELQEQNTKSTFNAGETLKFAIDKKTFYFIDAKGKEKKGDVVGRKELKP